MEAEFVLKVCAGKGERSIICHVCSSTNDLLNGFLLIFCGGKPAKSDDYHIQMNTRVSDWLKTKVFPPMRARGKMCAGIVQGTVSHISRRKH